jgi:tetratricopeptide (TPR) repeat protein
MFRIPKRYLLIIVPLVLCSLSGFANKTTNINNEADSLNFILGNSKISTCEILRIFKKQGEKFQKEENYLKALDYYNYALNYSDTCADYYEKAQVLEKIADVYCEVNDYEKALPIYLEAIQQYNNVSKIENTFKILDNISNLYLDIGLYPNALYCLKLSRYFYLGHARNHITELMKNSLNIGVAYGQQNILDSSLYFFKNALHYADIKNSPIEYGGILNNIGAIYSKKEQIDTALKYYNEALFLFKKIEYKKGVGISLGNIAYINKKEKKYTEAIEKFLKSIQYLIEAKALYNLLVVYQDISETYKDAGKYNEALFYNEKYLSLQDSISSNERINNLMQTEMHYKIAQKDNELKILEQQKLLIQKENDIKEIRQYFLVGGLALFLFIGFLVFRNMRFSIRNIQLKQNLLAKEKQQLATDLELRNKDLENYAFRIVEKNEFLENLKKEIAALHGADQDIKRLLNISNSIRSNLHIDNEALELENKINEVYKGFMNKLDIKYPDLSKTEKRLCSLMVLDLSSKDIASILNIAPESVKKGRYRLRKKLNLESEEDISNFLKSL